MKSKSHKLWANCKRKLQSHRQSQYQVSMYKSDYMYRVTVEQKYLSFKSFLTLNASFLINLWWTIVSLKINTYQISYICLPPNCAHMTLRFTCYTGYHKHWSKVVLCHWDQTTTHIVINLTKYSRHYNNNGCVATVATCLKRFMQTFVESQDNYKGFSSVKWLKHGI